MSNKHRPNICDKIRQSFGVIIARVLELVIWVLYESVKAIRDHQFSHHIFIFLFCAFEIFTLFTMRHTASHQFKQRFFFLTKPRLPSFQLNKFLMQSLRGFHLYRKKKNKKSLQKANQDLNVNKQSRPRRHTYVFRNQQE